MVQTRLPVKSSSRNIQKKHVRRYDDHLTIVNEGKKEVVRTDVQRKRIAQKVSRARRRQTLDLRERLDRQVAPVMPAGVLQKKWFHLLRRDPGILTKSIQQDMEQKGIKLNEGEFVVTEIKEILPLPSTKPGDSYYMDLSIKDSSGETKGILIPIAGEQQSYKLVAWLEDKKKKGEKFIVKTKESNVSLAGPVNPENDLPMMAHLWGVRELVHVRGYGSGPIIKPYRHRKHRVEQMGDKIAIFREGGKVGRSEIRRFDSIEDARKATIQAAKKNLDLFGDRLSNQMELSEITDYKPPENPRKAFDQWREDAGHSAKPEGMKVLKEGKLGYNFYYELIEGPDLFNKDGRVYSVNVIQAMPGNIYKHLRHVSDGFATRADAEEYLARIKKNTKLDELNNVRAAKEKPLQELSKMMTEYGEKLANVMQLTPSAFRKNGMQNMPATRRILEAMEKAKDDDKKDPLVAEVVRKNVNLSLKELEELENAASSNHDVLKASIARQMVEKQLNEIGVPQTLAMDMHMYKLLWENILNELSSEAAEGEYSYQNLKMFYRGARLRFDTETSQFIRIGRLINSRTKMKKAEREAKEFNKWTKELDRMMLKNIRSLMATK